jgi:hypothetical protein
MTDHDDLIRRLRANPARGYNAATKLMDEAANALEVASRDAVRIDYLANIGDDHGWFIRLPTGDWWTLAEPVSFEEAVAALAERARK